MVMEASRRCMATDALRYCRRALIPLLGAPPHRLEHLAEEEHRRVRAADPVRSLSHAELTHHHGEPLSPYVGQRLIWL